MNNANIMKAKMKFIDILREAIQHKKGEVFFAEDFLHVGELSKIRRALSILVQYKEINRIGRGIYHLPIIDELIGPIAPSFDDIVQKIAVRDQIIIRPTGAYALNRLGFSTQVPMRIVYFTSGPSRKIKLGKAIVLLKHRNPKYMRAKNDTVYLLIQALIEIGDYIKNSKGHQEQLIKILRLIPSEIVKQDAGFAPTWVTRYLHSTLDMIEEKEVLNPSV